MRSKLTPRKLLPLVHSISFATLAFILINLHMFDSQFDDGSSLRSIKLLIMKMGKLSKKKGGREVAVIAHKPSGIAIRNMRTGDGAGTNRCCDILKYQLTQKMVTIIACAVHIIFTFVVFIYLSVSASLAAVILFPIAIVAYVTFFLGMKLENAKLFIPLLIYLVRITQADTNGTHDSHNANSKNDIHISAIDSRLNYPAAIVLLSLDLCISLLLSWPIFVYYRFLRSEAMKQSEVANEPAFLRQTAYYTSTRNVADSIHSAERIQRADPAALYDTVPFDGDPQPRSPSHIMNLSSEIDRSGTSQSTARTQYSGDFSESELEPHQPYSERAIN
uniref:DUF1218 domain-containing protein n=1 Tax=Ascaris lumbricoides TaxID=6252 RepID=A0A0M3IAW0_ASCLU